MFFFTMMFFRSLEVGVFAKRCLFSSASIGEGPVTNGCVYGSFWKKVTQKPQKTLFLVIFLGWGGSSPHHLGLQWGPAASGPARVPKNVKTYILKIQMSPNCTKRLEMVFLDM